MAGVQLKVLPRFPAQVTGTLPIVVTKTGLTYNISYSQPAGVISVTQVKRQLVVLGLFDTAAAAIPGNPQDPINMAWSSGGSTQTTGPMMTAIFSAINYNTQTLQNGFINAALALTY